MNIDIAYRLATIRRQHGLSQEALANQIGVSRQAVSKWERAESSPDTDNLIALARLYGMTLDELLTVADEEEPAVCAGEGEGRAGEDDGGRADEEGCAGEEGRASKGAGDGERASGGAGEGEGQRADAAAGAGEGQRAGGDAGGASAGECAGEDAGDGERASGGAGAGDAVSPALVGCPVSTGEASNVDDAASGALACEASALLAGSAAAGDPAGSVDPDADAAVPGASGPSASTNPADASVAAFSSAADSFSSAGASGPASSSPSSDSTSPAADLSAQGKSGDYVHFGRDGLYVRDSDGAEVRIGRGGIHLYDPEDEDGQEVHVGRDGVTVDGTNYGWSYRGSGRDDILIRGHAVHEDAGARSWAASFPWALIVIVAYVLVGVFLGEWARGLPLLMLIPLAYVLAAAVRTTSPRRRRGDLQALLVLAVITVFLCLGLLGGMWHPGWVVLLAIPVVLSVWEAISPKRNLPKEPSTSKG